MTFAIYNVNLEQTRRNTEYLTGLENSHVAPFKLVVITHSVDADGHGQGLGEPIFWEPFIQNIKYEASNYGNQIKGINGYPFHKDPSIYNVGSMNSAQRQKLATEIVAADPDIIALTGAIDIITDMYDYIIKDCGIPHFFFNIEPPNLPSSTTNYFGYAGQYETDGNTGKLLAKLLKTKYQKKFAIVLNNEPQSSVPDGTLALRAEGIKSEFGHGNFIERSPNPTFTFDSSDPAYVYFTDTSAAINFKNDVSYASDEPNTSYNEEEIAVIGVTPAYLNYMANHQSIAQGNNPKITYSAFDTLPSSYGMPTDWQEIVFQNPHEQAKSLVKMAIQYKRNGTKQFRITGPRFLGDYLNVPAADSENFEIKFL